MSAACEWCEGAGCEECGGAAAPAAAAGACDWCGGDGCEECGGGAGGLAPPDLKRQSSHDMFGDFYHTVPDGDVWGMEDEVDAVEEAQTQAKKKGGESDDDDMGAGDNKDDEESSAAPSAYKSVDKSGLMLERKNLIAEAAKQLGVQDAEADVLLRYLLYAPDKVTRFQKDAKQRAFDRDQSGIHGHANKKPTPAGELTCPTCFCPSEAKDTHSLDCNHSVCNDCWTGWLNSEIDNNGMNSVFSKCPGNDEEGKKCREPVDLATMKKFLDAKRYEKLENWILDHWLQSDKSLKWCPAPGCQRAIVTTVNARKVDYVKFLNENDLNEYPATFEKAGYTSILALAEQSAQDSKLVRVKKTLVDLDPNYGEGSHRRLVQAIVDFRIKTNLSDVGCLCGFRFCFECSGKAHAPVPCDLARKWQTEINDEEAASARMIQQLTKPCPKCGTRIEKDRHCNHMKCSTCNFDFCWQCLEAMVIGAKHPSWYVCENRQKQEQEGKLGEVEKARLEAVALQAKLQLHVKHAEDRQRDRKAAEKLLASFQTLEGRYAGSADIDWIRNLIESVLLSEHFLEWSYVYTYFMKGSSGRTVLFHQWQSSLEADAGGSLHDMQKHLNSLQALTALVDDKKRRQELTKTNKKLQEWMGFIKKYIVSDMQSVLQEEADLEGGSWGCTKCGKEMPDKKDGKRLLVCACGACRDHGDAACLVLACKNAGSH